MLNATVTTITILFKFLGGGLWQPRSSSLDGVSHRKPWNRTASFHKKTGAYAPVSMNFDLAS